MKTNVRAGVDAAKNGDGADKEEDNREEEEEEEEELVKENARRRAALETTVAKFTDDAVPSMTVREVLNVINNQEENAKRTVLFLDCREKEERAVSIIPGASSAEEFEDDFEKQQDDGKETIVVCYCTIGYRSSYAARALAADADLRQQLAAAPSPTTAEGSAREQAPRVRVHNLRGGVLAWAHAQREFLTVAPAGSNDGNDGGDGEDRGGVSRTRALHVYGRRWDLAPSNYEATWYSMLGWT